MVISQKNREFLPFLIFTLEIFQPHLKSFIYQKKSRIRETEHLFIDADSSTDTKKILLLRQNEQTNFFCAAI